MLHAFQKKARTRYRQIGDHENKMTKSCGNVFVDLGFDPVEATVLQVRANLMSALILKTHRLKQIPEPQVKIPRSKLVRFNLNPVRLDRTDVRKALSVVIHALQSISVKGHNPVPLVSNTIGFRGQRILFANLAAEVGRALKITVRG